MGLAAPLPAAWRGCQVGGEQGLEREHPRLREGALHPILGATKEESWTWGSSDERCFQVKAVSREMCAEGRVLRLRRHERL